MAVINWPTGATPGDIYVSPEGDRWVWNGSAWDGISGAANIGPQGPQGAATGPQGPIGSTGPAGSNLSMYDVLLIASWSNNYLEDAFWFRNTYSPSLSSGSTLSLSVMSLEVNSVEYIATPVVISITGSTGPSDKWFFYGGTVSGAEYAPGIIIADHDAVGQTEIEPKIPVKWMSHLNSLGDPIGVKFNGVTDFSKCCIALKDDVDFKMVIEREIPGIYDNDAYWYKYEYSSSTKIATLEFSDIGATGPWGAMVNLTMNAFLGPFYT